MVVLTPPLETVIVTVPTPTEVIRPEEETVAIEASDVDQTTLAPLAIGVPLESTIVAVS